MEKQNKKTTAVIIGKVVDAFLFIFITQLPYTRLEWPTKDDLTLIIS